MKGVSVTPGRGRSGRMSYAMLGLGGKRVFSPSLLSAARVVLARHRARVLRCVRGKLLDGRVTSGLYVDVRAIRVRQRGLLRGLNMRGSVRTVGAKLGLKLLGWVSCQRVVTSVLRYLRPSTLTTVPRVPRGFLLRPRWRPSGVLSLWSFPFRRFRASVSG